MHRAHRQPATLPRRRGMRASGFRGRAAHDLEVPVQDGLTTPPDAGPAGPAEAPVVPPVRPATSNPTS